MKAENKSHLKCPGFAVKAGEGYIFIHEYREKWQRKKTLSEAMAAVSQVHC